MKATFLILTILKATVQKQSSKESLPKVSSEAAVSWGFSKEVFLKISHRCFPVNIAKFYKQLFYRTPPVAVFVDLVCFTTRVPDTSDTSVTRVRHERHECNTSATWTTRARHQCFTNDTSATQMKNFDFDNNMSENLFSHPILAIWQMKDCKERNNFILRAAFWKFLVPMPKCIGKVHHKNWTL